MGPLINYENNYKGCHWNWSIHVFCYIPVGSLVYTADYKIKREATEAITKYKRKN